MASKKQKKRKHRMDSKKGREALERGKKGGGSGSSYLKLPEGVDWFKPEYKEGKKSATYFLNVVPFTACKYNPEQEEGELWWRSKFRIGKVGPEEKKVISPSVFGEDCPMTDLYFKMKDDENISKEELDKLGTKQRELYYVVDTKNEDAGITLLDFSAWHFGKMLDEEMASEEYEEEDYDTIMFADPIEGRTLKVVFKQETFMKSQFSKPFKMELIKRRGSEVTDEMIDSLEDPIMLLDRKTPKQIKSLMAANEVDDGDDEDSVDDDDLEMMNRSQLKKYIKENELEIKVTKKMDEDDIRDAIQEYLDSDEEEEEDEEEDDIPYEEEDEDEDEDTDTDDDDEDEDEDEDWED